MYHPTHQWPVYQSPYCCIDGRLQCGFNVTIKGQRSPTQGVATRKHAKYQQPRRLNIDTRRQYRNVPDAVQDGQANRVIVGANDWTGVVGGPAGVVGGRTRSVGD